MSASISTPVREVVLTSVVISTLAASGAPSWKSTVTLATGRGWHSGTSSGVFLAAMIPAMRAVPSASPLGRPSWPSRSITSSVVVTTAWARAVREVTSLAETSTIWALPSERTWVRCEVSAMSPPFGQQDGLADGAGRQVCVLLEDLQQGIGLRQVSQQV